MKHLVCLTAAIGIVGVAYAQHPQSHLEVRKSSDGGHILVLQTKTSSNVEAGRLELSPEIKRICGAQPAHFGEFAFHAESKEGPFLLTQQISCVDVASPPSTVVTDETWRPTAEQQKIVLDLTDRYFRLRDAGGLEQGRELLSETMRFDLWQEGAQRFNKQGGGVRYRKMEKITWYKDRRDALAPGTIPNDLAPGIVVAINISGQLLSSDLYCGLVMWHQGKDEAFRVIRDEENYISLTGQQTITADQLMKMRKNMRC